MASQNRRMLRAVACGAPGPRPASPQVWGNLARGGGVFAARFSSGTGRGSTQIRAPSVRTFVKLTIGRGLAVAVSPTPHRPYCDFSSDRMVQRVPSRAHPSPRASLPSPAPSLHLCVYYPTTGGGGFSPLRPFSNYRGRGFAQLGDGCRAAEGAPRRENSQRDGQHEAPGRASRRQQGPLGEERLRARRRHRW